MEGVGVAGSDTREEEVELEGEELEVGVAELLPIY